MGEVTALAVVERREWAGEFDPEKFAVRKECGLFLRHLERMGRGMSYPEMAARVATVARDPVLAGRCTLAVGVSDVGKPVLDLVRQSDPQCSILPVMITGEGQARHDGHFHRLPLRDLVTELAVLVEMDELLIAQGLAEGGLLVEGMMTLRSRVRPTDRDGAGRLGEGSGDDLVLATALACWGVRTVDPLRHGGYCQADWVCPDAQVQERLDQKLIRLALGGWGGPP